MRTSQLLVLNPALVSAHLALVRMRSVPCNDNNAAPAKLHCRWYEIEIATGEKRLVSRWQ